MNQNKKSKINLNLGSSSLLLIFVVLSLVSFAVLSLSTALSDKELTHKTVSRSLAYYNACNQAQDSLALIDTKLCDIYAASTDEASYLAACEEIDTTIKIPVSEYHMLEIVVNPNYPKESGDTFYSLESWKLIYSSEPNIDFSINVIK